MQDKSLLSILFDLSFTEFITTRIIKVVFVLAVIASGFVALGMIIAGFNAGFVTGVGGLILAAIVFLLYVLMARVWCELVIAVFRIAENTSRMVTNTKQ